MQRANNSNPSSTGTYPANAEYRCDKRFLPNVNKKGPLLRSWKSSSSSSTHVRWFFHICPPYRDEKHTKNAAERTVPRRYSRRRLAQRSSKFLRSVLPPFLSIPRDAIVRSTEPPLGSGSGLLVPQRSPQKNQARRVPKLRQSSDCQWQ